MLKNWRTKETEITDKTDHMDEAAKPGTRIVSSENSVDAGLFGT